MAGITAGFSGWAPDGDRHARMAPPLQRGDAMTIPRTGVLATCLAIALAVPLQAQQHLQRPTTGSLQPHVDWTDHNEFSMEPYSGIFLDGMVQDNTREMGPLLGVRMGFEPMHRLRVLVDLGFSEVNGVGTTSVDGSTFTYGNDWIFTMLGGEFDVVPGNTAGTFTLSAGVAWRKSEAERRVVGTGDTPDLGGFASLTVVAPGVALAHMLSPRAAVRLSIQDFVVDVDENPEHSPALTLGVVFR